VTRQAPHLSEGGVVSLFDNFILNFAALIASVSAFQVEQKSVVHYTYEDIREQELKCKADRNREWKYDAATNTWACPLQRYD